MSDDSNGIFSLPAGSIVSVGDTVLPSQHNPPLQQIATALSNRFSKDGRAPATGNWNLNSFRITGLAAPVANGDAVNKDYSDSAVQTLTNKTLVSPSGVFLRGHIFGLTLSNSVSDPTNDIDIAAGEAASDGTIPYLMALASPITKRLDALWAVGSNNGGLDTGAVTNGTYHVWLIQRSDTGVVDALFSTSATSPIMPTNYDRKAYLWPIVRAGGTILAFFQRGNFFYLSSGVVDRSSTASAAGALVTLTVPTGVRVKPLLTNTVTINAVGSMFTSIGPGDGLIAPFVLLTGQYASQNVGASSFGGVHTNTSGQIRYTVTIGGSLTSNSLSTVGWIFERGD